MSHLICADARHIPLADNYVQCVVTSPPYWGLRKYAGEQESIWGELVACQHEWNEEKRKYFGGGFGSASTLAGNTSENVKYRALKNKGAVCAVCAVCGAWRGAYGLEPTIEMYVAHTVEILREIRRVLRPDGVAFWNIGDSYAGGGGFSKNAPSSVESKSGKYGLTGGLKSGGLPVGSGLKAKDLCLIPSRVALAAQADGWWVRSLIIWAKPNPMPESVTDRPTDAYEHIIMLTKSARYFWDAEAVRENLTPSSVARLSQDVEQQQGSDRVPGKTNGPMKAVAHGGWNGSKFTDKRDSDTKPGLGTGPRNEVPGRNIRNVWSFATQPYSGAHFATFPEELPRRCILAASKVGDLVLDPFGGSGTTGRVAIELRRRCVLLDLAYAHEYGPLAMKRTTNVQLEAFA